ncbi:unnamed protein product [Prorocentrum cordatum]|uniref:Uncharacterized protein n=1 Tax=Prorocentrum cordatum TaxID=2364126 RepID=A0ABN9WYG2_9DINO|nr:unnamed protein product [Polarella glacialis]
MAVAFTFGHVPTSEESRLASDGELAPRRTAMRLTRSDSRRLAWHSRWMMGASGRAVNCLMLVGSTVCHSLAAVGMWMFPQDFLKELLVGVYFAAAGLIITRLSSEGGNQPMFRRAIEAAILLTLFLSVYLLVVVFPYNHGLWMNIILAVVVVMWSWATAALSKQARAARFVLLCAVCFLSAVFPTFFAMAVRNVTSFTLWTPALAPTGLLIVSFFSEEVVGHLMVKHCEFTAETQWMLAIVFRFCVEAVRFNTALSVILLLQVSKASWWWLVLHLVQTALYETVWIFRRLWDQNQANSVSTLGESTAEGGLPFTNGEIVLRTCFHPCQYRARAAMLPIEASLLLAHVCQLATMGMPVGPSTGAWVGGIGCIGGAALCREGAIAVLGRTFQSTMPTMPWAKLPVHLVAMMTGVGAVTAIFAQVQNHWLLYAHHWAACFLGGPGHDEGTDISKDRLRHRAFSSVGRCVLDQARAHPST